MLVRPEKDGGAVLIDYDCVTRVGTVRYVARRPRAARASKPRHRAPLDDDEHLWTRLQGM